MRVEYTYTYIHYMHACIHTTYIHTYILTYTRIHILYVIMCIYICVYTYILGLTNLLCVVHSLERFKGEPNAYSYTCR